MRRYATSIRRRTSSSRTSSQQAGFDRLAGIVDAGPASLPVAFETVIALALTALTDLDIGSTMGDPVDEAEGDSIRTIRFNERALRAMEWQAARRASSGDADSVISIARAAAEWASSHHPGRLLSPDLEETLRKAGRSVVKNFDPWRGGNGRVLHVLTNAAEVGGHTRLVDRWIRFDVKREHSMVLTEQVKKKVPNWLWHMQRAASLSLKPARGRGGAGALRSNDRFRLRRTSHSSI